MGIAAHRFEADRIAALGRLFSEEIDTDPWIMFHGTSGFNAKSVERDGFKFSSALDELAPFGASTMTTFLLRQLR
jgi:hypothetical protein